MLVAIDDIGLGGLPVRGGKEDLFHDILNFFYGDDPAVKDLLGQVQDPDGEYFCLR